jgi:hypothetical protein
MRTGAMLRAAAGVAGGGAYVGPTLFEEVEKLNKAAADPWNFAAADFAGGYLYLVCVGSNAQTKPSGVTGVTGCTFAEYQTKQDAQGQTTIWWGIPATDVTAQTLSIDWAAAATGGAYLVKVSHEALVVGAPFAQFKATQLGDVGVGDSTHATATLDTPPTKAVFGMCSRANDASGVASITAGATILNQAGAPVGKDFYYDATSTFLTTIQLVLTSGANWSVIMVELD